MPSVKLEISKKDLDAAARKEITKLKNQIVRLNQKLERRDYNVKALERQLLEANDRAVFGTKLKAAFKELSEEVLDFTFSCD